MTDLSAIRARRDAAKFDRFESLRTEKDRSFDMDCGYRVIAAARDRNGEEMNVQLADGASEGFANWLLHAPQDISDLLVIVGAQNSHIKELEALLSKIYEQHPEAKRFDNRPMAASKDPS